MCSAHLTHCAETAQRRKVLFLLWIPPRFFTSRFARWPCFSYLCDRLEILPLRGAFISGLQPQARNLSFSKLSETPAGS
jgi:hypothetical protein